MMQNEYLTRMALSFLVQIELIFQTYKDYSWIKQITLGDMPKST